MIIILCVCICFVLLYSADYTWKYEKESVLKFDLRV